MCNKLRHTWLSAFWKLYVSTTILILNIMFLSVKLLTAHCCSVTKSCPDLCNSMDCSMPGLPVLHYILGLAQTYYVHWVGDAIQPFHPLLPPSSLALKLFQHQGIFQWVDPSYQVAKVSASASVLSLILVEIFISVVFVVLTLRLPKNTSFLWLQYPVTVWSAEELFDHLL